MSGGLIPLVVVGLLGLAIGIWLGMPGRDRPTVDDIERAMDSGGGRRRRTKRIFTPMAWLQRKADAKSSRTRTPGRRGFSIERPDERD